VALLSNLPAPTEEQAFQFAVIVQSGLPAGEALLYFVESNDPAELAAILRKWQQSPAVRRAQLKLMGKAWHEMSTEERSRYALDQHYSQLAAILYQNHYGEAEASLKAKMDVARQALESKLAGTSGKLNVMEQFFDDIRTGKVKLNKPLPPSVLPS
jgi:hypothetical protein